MNRRRAGQHARERFNLHVKVWLVTSVAALMAGEITALIVGRPMPALVWLLLVVGVFAYPFFTQKDFVREALNWRQGAQGEEAVGRILETLPASFHVLHDVDTGRGNIDHVVVGPTGVFVVETKAWTGRVYLDGEGHLMCGRRSQERIRKQVTAQVFEVKRRLDLASQSQWVHGVVVLVATQLPKGTIHLGHLKVMEARELPCFITSCRASMDLREVGLALQAVRTNARPPQLRVVG